MHDGLDSLGPVSGRADRLDWQLSVDSSTQRTAVYALARTVV